MDASALTEVIDSVQSKYPPLFAVEDVHFFRLCDITAMVVHADTHESGASLANLEAPLDKLQEHRRTPPVLRPQ